MHVVRLGARGQPGVVMPGIGRLGGCHRGGAGCELARERIGVRLVQQLAGVGLDDVLVQLPRPDAGHEAAPDAAREQRLERVCLGIPAVKVANDVDAAHVRGPHGKAIASAPIPLAGMGAHLLVAAVPRASAHEIQVVVRDVERAGARCASGPGISHVTPPPLGAAPDAFFWQQPKLRIYDVRSFRAGASPLYAHNLSGKGNIGKGSVNGRFCVSCGARQRAAERCKRVTYGASRGL